VFVHAACAAAGTNGALGLQIIFAQLDARLKIPDQPKNQFQITDGNPVPIPHANLKKPGPVFRG
jgi:hypothetical protein